MWNKITQSELFNKVANGSDYAVQRFVPENGWTEIFSTDLKTLKEARTEALTVSSNLDMDARIVRISRYLSEGEVVIQEVVQFFPKRKA